MIRVYVLTLVFLIGAGCSLTNKKPNETDDRAIEEYYKQFDSTLTKEKLDSFKTVLDARTKWRDSKIKRRF